MMLTQAIVLQTLLSIAPPGNTKYSITPTECRADECDGLKHSTFYDSYYHQETRDEGAIRYAVILDSMFAAAQQELCLEQLSGEAGSKWSKVEGCTPNPRGQGWLVGELVVETIGVTIPESGFREDVEVGRGHARRKHDSDVDDAGGEGRGPNGEACLMQIIPSSIGQFAPVTPQFPYGTPASVLGSDHEHLVQCFRTGMRMLIQARAHCNWEYSIIKANWIKQGIFNADRPAYYEYSAMFAMYGTGNSCWSSNGGKTQIRTGIAYKVDDAVKNRIRIAIKEEKAKRSSL